MEHPVYARSPRNGNGEGWRKSLLGVLAAVVLGCGGWIATYSVTTRDDMTKQLAENEKRIAVMEEALRGVRETLIRIEGGVDELRRQQQSGRK